MKSPQSANSFSHSLKKYRNAKYFQQEPSLSPYQIKQGYETDYAKAQKKSNKFDQDVSEFLKQNSCMSNIHTVQSLDLDYASEVEAKIKKLEVKHLVESPTLSHISHCNRDLINLHSSKQSRNEISIEQKAEQGNLTISNVPYKSPAFQNKNTKGEFKTLKILQESNEGERSNNILKPREEQKEKTVEEKLERLGSKIKSRPHSSGEKENELTNRYLYDTVQGKGVQNHLKQHVANGYFSPECSKKFIHKQIQIDLNYKKDNHSSSNNNKQSSFISKFFTQNEDKERKATDSIRIINNPYISEINKDTNNNKNNNNNNVNNLVSTIDNSKQNVAIDEILQKQNALVAQQQQQIKQYQDQLKRQTLEFQLFISEQQLAQQQQLFQQQQQIIQQQRISHLNIPSSSTSFLLPQPQQVQQQSTISSFLNLAQMNQQQQQQQQNQIPIIINNNISKSQIDACQQPNNLASSCKDFALNSFSTNQNSILSPIRPQQQGQGINDNKIEYFFPQMNKHESKNSESSSQNLANSISTKGSTQRKKWDFSQNNFQSEEEDSKSLGIDKVKEYPAVSEFSQAPVVKKPVRLDIFWEREEIELEKRKESKKLLRKQEQDKQEIPFEQNNIPQLVSQHQKQECSITATFEVPDSKQSSCFMQTEGDEIQLQKTNPSFQDKFIEKTYNSNGDSSCKKVDQKVEKEILPHSQINVVYPHQISKGLKNQEINVSYYQAPCSDKKTATHMSSLSANLPSFQPSVFNIAPIINLQPLGSQSFNTRFQQQEQQQSPTQNSQYRHSASVQISQKSVNSQNESITYNYQQSSSINSPQKQHSELKQLCQKVYTKQQNKQNRASLQINLEGVRCSTHSNETQELTFQSPRNSECVQSRGVSQNNYCTPKYTPQCQFSVSQVSNNDSMNSSTNSLPDKMNQVQSSSKNEINQSHFASSSSKQLVFNPSDIALKQISDHSLPKQLAQSGQELQIRQSISQSQIQVRQSQLQLQSQLQQQQLQKCQKQSIQPQQQLQQQIDQRMLVRQQQQLQQWQKEQIPVSDNMIKNKQKSEPYQLYHAMLQQKQKRI